MRHVASVGTPRPVYSTIVVLICDGVIVAFLVQRSVAQSLLVKITYLEKLDPEYEDASMKTEALKIFQSTKRSAYFVIV